MSFGHRTRVRSSEDGRLLPRSFYERAPQEVAPELLGKVVATAAGSGRVVEVEAYDGAVDPGSHAYRGRTPRTEVMFGPAGYLYVYFSYGMHWCANVVCRDEGIAAAVLIRALAPLTGTDGMFSRRVRARRHRDLCSGPAKLCEALAIAGAHNGVDVTDGCSPVQLLDDGAGSVSGIVQTNRVGLSAGAELPWRWYVAGDPNVSRKG